VSCSRSRGAAAPAESYPAVVERLASRPVAAAESAAAASRPAADEQPASRPGVADGAAPGESRPAVQLAAWLACAVRLAEQLEPVAVAEQPRPADARAASARARC